jgi:hypothetical protein
VALVLLRVGSLVKAKFAGTEIEFAAIVVNQSNDLTVEIETLKADVADLRSVLASSRAAATPAASAAASTTPAAAMKRMAMPALPPARRKDDPHKFRFGEKPERDGYRLSVEFSGERSASLVSLKLYVDRTDHALVTQRVHFFLHPTFSKDEVVVQPTDGRATLALVVYGGFTVGAWIEGTGTLLELDLAEVPGAPDVIRDR